MQVAIRWPVARPRGWLRWRALLSLATMAILGGLLLPVPVMAAPIVRFDVGYGACQIRGHAAPGVSLLVVWRSRDGELKHRQRLTVPGDGDWNTACAPEAIQRGDTIRGTIGGVTRTLTVGRLTMDIDRGADEVSGKGPLSTFLTVTHHRTSGFRDDASPVVVPLNTDSVGDYWVGMPGDLKGGDWLELRWTKDSGDVIFRSLWVPLIIIFRNQSGLGVHTRPGRAVSLELLDGSLTKKSSFSGTADIDGWTGGSWTDGPGDAEYPRTGDTVDGSSVASDATFEVPAVAISATPYSDVVRGTCVPDGRYEFRAMRPDGSPDVYRRGTADGSGNFTTDVTARFDVRSGDKLLLNCALASGDEVRRWATVP